MLIILEIAAVLLILLYLYFAAKRNPTAWIFGIIASLLSVVLFYNKDLYASMILNVIYSLQGIMGFFHWKLIHPNKKPSYQMPLLKHLIVLISALSLSVFLFFIFNSLKIREFIFWDILLALLSIIATFLEIRKDNACWWYWMICNIGYAVLYTLHTAENSGMYFYAVLMLALAVFSWFALKVWEKAILEIKY